MVATIIVTLPSPWEGCPSPGVNDLCPPMSSLVSQKQGMRLLCYPHSLQQPVLWRPAVLSNGSVHWGLGPGAVWRQSQLHPACVLCSLAVTGSSSHRYGLSLNSKCLENPLSPESLSLGTQSMVTSLRGTPEPRRGCSGSSFTLYHD